MQERERGQLRRSEPRTRQGNRSDEYEDHTEGGRTSMTTSSATAPERQDQPAGSEAGGGWSGYVVPYRYYGPGYRGVGYYSVMYQGGGEDEEPGESQYGQRAPAQRSAWNDRAAAFGRAGGGRGFAGRGPKGYQRSDERLRDEVSDRLMADDQIDASDIEVDVRNGEVTLTGTVPDRWAKRRAEDCAEQVMGVRDVMNQIRVQGGTYEGGNPDSGSTRNDSASRTTEDKSTGTNGRKRTSAQSH